MYHRFQVKEKMVLPKKNHLCKQTPKIKKILYVYKQFHVNTMVYNPVMTLSISLLNKRETMLTHGFVVKSYTNTPKEK